MDITIKPLSDLHPTEKNVRIHPIKQIAEYKRSIKMFGQIRPLIVDETGEVIVGNGLFLAMSDMGYETAECYVFSGLSKKQKTKLMMADNKIYDLGLTNTSILEEIVTYLDKDFDVPGWDAEILGILDSTKRDIDNMIDDLCITPPKQNETEQVQHIKYQSNAENETNPEPVTDKRRTIEVERTEKYVICPRCGEKICL